MRFAAGLTATGVIGWLLLEALKILMIPVTAWVMGLLAAALKIAPTHRPNVGDLRRRSTATS